MYFIDKEHEKFYQKKLGQVKRQDSYINSLIYLLSSNSTTREHFTEIYDIKNNVINVDCLKLQWQTGTSINTCRLAFNLFGNITSDNIEEETSYLYTISTIFGKLDLNVGIEALKIRF